MHTTRHAANSLHLLRLYQTNSDHGEVQRRVNIRCNGLDSFREESAHLGAAFLADNGQVGALACGVQVGENSADSTGDERVHTAAKTFVCGDWDEQVALRECAHVHVLKRNVWLGQ